MKNLPVVGDGSGFGVGLLASDDFKDERPCGIPDLLCALDYEYAQWKRTRKGEDPLAPALVDAVRKLRPGLTPTSKAASKWLKKRAEKKKYKLVQCVSATSVDEHFWHLQCEGKPLLSAGMITPVLTAMHTSAMCMGSSALAAECVSHFAAGRYAGGIVKAAATESSYVPTRTFLAPSPVFDAQCACTSPRTPPDPYHATVPL